MEDPTEGSNHTIERKRERELIMLLLRGMMKMEGSPKPEKETGKRARRITWNRRYKVNLWMVLFVRVGRARNIPKVYSVEETK